MSGFIDPFDFPKKTDQKYYYYPVEITMLFFEVINLTKDTTNPEMGKIIQRIESTIDSLLWVDYNWAEKRHNNLILISTGDGYAIGFHPKIENEKILYITTELFKYITKDSVQIRIGIAKGNNIRHVDRNDNINLFGYGMKLAKRVMNIALDNQILIHENYAKELLNSRKIQGLVEIENPIKDKKGEKIKVFNYYNTGPSSNYQNISAKKHKIFISYSHKDEKEKDQLEMQLGVLRRQGLIDFWDDRRIKTGGDWYEEIKDAIAEASVAILLISANYFNSEFIYNEEIPRLLEGRKNQGLHIFPIIIKPCAWQAAEWLSRMQVWLENGKPLSSIKDKNKRDEKLTY